MRPHIIQDHTAAAAQELELAKARSLLAVLTMRETKDVTDDEAENFHPFVMLAEHMIRQSPDPAAAYSIAAAISSVTGMVITGQMTESEVLQAAKAYGTSSEKLFAYVAKGLFQQRRNEAVALARQSTLA